MGAVEFEWKDGRFVEAGKPSSTPRPEARSVEKSVGLWAQGIKLVKTLNTMVRDRTYRFPLKTKIALVFAIIYAISPLDIIPDFLTFFLGFGLIDDVGVIAFAIRMLMLDAAEYAKARGSKLT